MKRSNEDARSSQIFFTARVKNKRENTKLKYEIKQLEREFGHTVFSIHKDIRDLKAELKITKRSSGHSAEGWFVEDAEDAGTMVNHRSRPTKSAGGARCRTNALGHQRKQTRVSSAPAVGNSRDISMGRRLTKTPERSVRQDNQTVSNSMRVSKGKALITKNHGMRTSATKIVPAIETDTIDASLRMDEEKDKRKPAKNKNKSTDIDGDFAKETERSEENSRTALKLVKKNSFLNPIIKPTLDVTDKMISDTNHVHNAEQYLSVNKSEERPLSPMMTTLVKDRWLKPTLKTTIEKDDVVDRPKKTVRIAPNSSHVHGSNRSNVMGNTQPVNPGNKKTVVLQKAVKSATFLTESRLPTVDPMHSTNSMMSLSSGLAGNSKDERAKKSGNVIPDIRRKVLSTEQVKMKRKRDNLLASSVSALLAGKSFVQKNAEGTSESGKEGEIESRPGSGTERGRSPSPKQRRRFSFGTITMLAMNQHRAFPVEKKATLGSRLKLKTPAEESEQRNIDIRKSVLVNDSDSDDDNHKKDYAVPAKPVIDLKNVKSKISNQWNQDAALEKPPTLADDTFQLQRSLAAAHISRGRDLRDMQDDNEVDPMKVIDDDRDNGDEKEEEDDEDYENITYDDDVDVDGDEDLDDDDDDEDDDEDEDDGD
ncbi:uncharacterized protein LOC105446455 [Strongylocentrotus purpuratus]|uniref:Uncharacterized protein n=1 Tax=Strongylocentrotus purpuratus TaxID=7668 RepID=A0A7M7LTY4_STRPU|nr:uncharacterized protein LOC105446455 [Strongylocentrotus purpuratus]